MNRSQWLKLTGLQQIRENIYAWINPTGDANAAIVIGKESIFLFDALSTPRQAADLDKFLKVRFNKSVATVIYSHWHEDHILGGQIFADDARILAHPKTREKLYADKESFVANAKKERLDIAADLDDARLVIPEETEINIEINTGTNVIQLMHWEPAHTEGDLIVWLEKEEVIFSSDLFFNNMIPYIGLNASGYRRCLERIMELPFKHIVPGHGNIGDRKSVERLIRLWDIVGSYAAGEKNADEILDPDSLPSELAEYNSWIKPTFLGEISEYVANFWKLFVRKIAGSSA